MKKWMAFWIALVMLLTAAAACGETAGTPDLYDVYRNSEAGRQWICTAVPVIEGVAVTSAAVDLKDTEVWDGKAFRAMDTVLTVADGTLAVLLFETDGEKPGIPAYDFMAYGQALNPAELLVRSGDWLQSRVNRAVYDASSITWKNRQALLLTLSGDTVAGAPLITAKGELAGIVVAEYAEGDNRYVALTTAELTGCLQEAAMMLEYDEEDTRPEGYKVTLDGNLVTFDWSGVTLPEVAEGEILYHIVADNDSSYLTYMQVLDGMTEQTLLLTPGRVYVSGLAAFPQTPNDLPAQMAVTVLPAAEPLTEHQFRSQVMAVAEMPADAPEGTMPTVPAEVTEELLRSGRACFYSVTSYEVDSTIENLSLLVTLTDPDGSNYRYESGWIYDPSYMSHDEWYVMLDDTGLLEMLNRNGYPKGIYQLDMYIDGKLADSVTFELTR